MKVLKKIIIVIVALMAIYVILAFIGPSKYRLERSIKIGSDIENVYNQTSIYANWAAWSPWKKADPEAIYTIENDKQEVGASLSWKGNLSGTGSMTTSEIVVNEKFLYTLVFTEPWYMAMTSNGGFTYEQDGDSVNVTWFDEGEIGFISRPFMLFMSLEDQIAPQFEEGLASIKEICEAMSSTPKVEIVEMEVSTKPILFISDSVMVTDPNVSATIGAGYGEIMAFVGAKQLTQLGVPMAITTNFSLTEMKWVFDCAIALNFETDDEVAMQEVMDAITTEGRINKGFTHAGKVVRATHVGPYEKSMATYNAIQKYMKDKGLEEDGRSWEEYLDDPTVVAPEELRTYIYFPIK